MFERSGQDLRLGLPKGHMQEAVLSLLAHAEIHLHRGEREYRPQISLPGFEVKILKPQNIVEMLHLGSRDVGFAGADWVAELRAEVVEVLDTELDPIRVVSAASPSVLSDGKLPKRSLVVASEYEHLTKQWIQKKGLEATFVRSYGATEVFPPEDADCIVDNTSSESTLRANNLIVIDELMSSSTRLYANPEVLKNQEAREKVEHLVLVLRSVLEARKRVMIEVNVPAKFLEGVVSVLPSMRKATVSSLHGGDGYAVKAAVPRKELPRLIPQIKAQGGIDIVVTTLEKIVV